MAILSWFYSNFSTLIKLWELYWVSKFYGFILFLERVLLTKWILCFGLSSQNSWLFSLTKFWGRFMNVLNLLWVFIFILWCIVEDLYYCVYLKLSSSISSESCWELNLCLSFSSLFRELKLLISIYSTVIDIFLKFSY